MLISDRILVEARRSLKPIGMLVGLALIAGFLFAGIAKNLTFARPWQDYREVRAQFNDVKGIFPGGHQVRIHGVKVGIVSESKLVDGRPVLTLKIEDKWGPVYKDAKLQIRPVTPLQDLYVNVLDRGSKSAGEATKSDIIASQQTVTPVDISRVLDTFNADTRQRMAILLSELGKGLDDGGVKLRQSFAEIAPFLHVAQDTTRVLAERKAAVRRVVHNFGVLSASLAKRDQDLNRFVVQGNSALGELARRDQPLAATLTGIAELLPVMRSAFASVQGLSGHLDPAVRGLRPVAARLNSGLASLQKLGDDAVPALRALRPAVGDLRTMARTLPATSQALSTAFQRFSPQAPQLDRATALLPGCMNTLQLFFQRTLSVFKWEDVNGPYPRGEMTIDTNAGSDTNAPALNLYKLPSCTDGK
jgi:ABC-type transporter Mla subunit MlaD